MKSSPYRWASSGDVNAFFGLMLDNIAGLVLTVGLLSAFFGFPVDFALRYMIPGTAIGVLIGDLMYFWLAFKLAAEQRRSDVTAMPLGLDTPSTIGMVFFVLGPAYVAATHSAFMEIAAAGDLVQDSINATIESVKQAARTDEAIDNLVNMVPHQAAMATWHIGICAILIMGLIKSVLAFGADWIRQVFPRAGLLGSLAAIALVLIAFTQMPDIAVNPIVGFASLVIVLATLVARGKLPFRIPGALGAVVTGCVIWYLLVGYDQATGSNLAYPAETASTIWFPIQWWSVFTFDWINSFGQAVGYLPYIIPFAIATVIGGIDCTESAASAGDEFQTSHIIGIEAAATILAGFCGGVIQTTPYIGHPAYKAMGGRAAYTLATALFVGGAGVIGYFSLLFNIIPKAAVLPILVFIGIEITAQSFHATPRRHYAALAIACLPALAKLVVIYLEIYVDPEKFYSDPGILNLRILAGGFIITSLIWASALARMIDRRFFSASLYFAVAGILVLFGFIHSPILGDKMFWPWNIGQVAGADGEMFVDPALRKIIIEFAVAYLCMALLMFGLGWIIRSEPLPMNHSID